MARQFIDLSVTLEDKPFKPEGHRPEIEYRDHDSDLTWEGFDTYFPGVPHDVLPEGKAWASERVSLSTHAGTHMDAPWHYHPTTDHALPTGVRKSAGIDEVPIEWCFGPGVKLDFRQFPAGYVVKAQDVEDELKRIGHDLQPLEIVLVNTRAGALYGTDGYWEAHCGMGREATLYLLEKGVRVVGTDGLGWDAPFSSMTQNFKDTGDPSVIWEGHKAGMDIGYFQMEKLHNLEPLPSTGFSVSCFPIKIKGASAGWVRAVAIVGEE